MKNVLCTVLFGLLWSAPARAQDTHEALAEEGLKAFNGYVEILTTIKDKSAVEKVKPDLKKFADKLADLKARVDKLGEPKGARKEELDKKFNPRFSDTIKKWKAEMDRIGKLDGGSAIVVELTAILDPKMKK